MTDYSEIILRCHEYLRECYQAMGDRKMGVAIAAASRAEREAAQLVRTLSTLRVQQDMEQRERK
jgi:hypothetical protein